MAFNREDLITWSELAPSFKTFLRSLASSNEQIAQILNDKLGHLERLQRKLDQNAAEIAALQTDTARLTKITTATVVDRMFKLKMEIETHKMSEKAHMETLNKAIMTNTDNKYHVGARLEFEDLYAKLKDIYDGVIIPGDATEDVPIHLGDAVIYEGINENTMSKLLQTKLEGWLNENAFDVYDDEEDSKYNYALTLFNEVRADLFNHENSVTAHGWNKVLFLACDTDYYIEKSYHLMIASHDNIYTDIDHAATPAPDYVPIAAIPVWDLYIHILNLESDFYSHVLDENAHGINTCELVYVNEPAPLYEISAIGTLDALDTYKIEIARREVPDTSNSVCFGMTYGGLYAFLDSVNSIGDAVAYNLLREIVDCKTALTEHKLETPPHDSILPSYMIYSPSTEYFEGTQVYVPGENRNIALIARNRGVTEERNAVLYPMVRDAILNETERRQQIIAAEKAAFEKLLLQTSPSTNLNDEAVTALKELMQELIDHEDDEMAHTPLTSIKLSHQSGTDYKKGERVYAKALDYPLMLEATNDGTSAATPPVEINPTATATPRVAPRVNPTRKTDYLANWHIEFDTHILDKNCHEATAGAVKYYKKGTFVKNDMVKIKYDPRYTFIATTDGTTNENGTDYSQFEVI